jgi:hypothetical protein
MSFLGDIKDAVKSEIQNLPNTLEGLPNGWGSVQEYREESQTFPSAYVTIEGEEFFEDVSVNTLTREATIKILIRDKLDSVGDDPKDDIQDRLFIHAQNMAYVFRSGSTIEDSGVYWSEFDSTEFPAVTTSDRYKPRKCIVMWKVRYTQDMQDPGAIGCA